MLNLFRNKKQVEDLKSIGTLLPDDKIVETTKLKLSSLHITYNISDRMIFRARIVYIERPTDYGNQGTSKEVSFTADSWPALIDKVLEHFRVKSDL